MSTFACDNQITKLSNEVVSWAKQIRAIKIEALHAELSRRIEHCDSQVIPMYRLATDAVAAESFLRDLGEVPEAAIINLRGIELPGIRPQPRPSQSDLIRQSKQALAAEWQI